MATQSEKVQKIASILKKRFPDLSVHDTIDIAFCILENLEELEKK